MKFSVSSKSIQKKEQDVIGQNPIMKSQTIDNQM